MIVQGKESENLSPNPGDSIITIAGRCILHNFITITVTSHWARWRPTYITSLTVVYLTVYSGIDQSSASLAFVRGIHRWPVNSPHKEWVTRKISPCDDVIMTVTAYKYHNHIGLTLQTIGVPNTSYILNDMWHELFNTLTFAQDSHQYVCAFFTSFQKEFIVKILLKFVRWLPLTSKLLI